MGHTHLLCNEYIRQGMLPRTKDSSVQDRKGESVPKEFLERKVVQWEGEKVDLQIKMDSSLE